MASQLYGITTAHRHDLAEVPAHTGSHDARGRLLPGGLRGDPAAPVLPVRHRDRLPLRAHPLATTKSGYSLPASTCPPRTTGLRTPSAAASSRRKSAAAGAPSPPCSATAASAPHHRPQPRPPSTRRYPRRPHPQRLDATRPSMINWCRVSHCQPSPCVWRREAGPRVALMPALKVSGKPRGGRSATGRRWALAGPGCAQRPGHGVAGGGIDAGGRGLDNSGPRKTASCSTGQPCRISVIDLREAASGGAQRRRS